MEYDIETTPLTMDILAMARLDYVHTYLEEPDAFGLDFSENNGWEVEWSSTHTVSGSRWLTGEEAVKLFWSLDVDMIDVDEFRSQRREWARMREQEEERRKAFEALR